MKKLLFCLVLLGCIFPTIAQGIPIIVLEPPTEKKVEVAVAAQTPITHPEILQDATNIDRKLIADTWAKAIELGGGDPKWEFHGAVILTPLDFFPEGRLWGMNSVSYMIQPDGEMRVYEIIQIWLSPAEQCLLPTVLLHEMLHSICRRRENLDATFVILVEKNDQEAYVRSLVGVGNAQMTCQGK